MDNEDIKTEINRLIDILEDACGMDRENTIKKIRQLTDMIYAKNSPVNPRKRVNVA